MAYVIIVIALAFMSVKGYCGKKTSCFVESTADAYMFNFLRMLLCMFIGIVLVLFEGAHKYLLTEGRMVAICLLAGFSNTLFLVGWILAIRKNTMVAVDVGLTLGSLIPAVLCALLFAEPISIPKMLGFALIVLATFVLAGHSKKTVGGGFVGFLFLLVATVGDGMSGFAQQLYKQYYTEAGSLASGVYYPKTIYHFYTYVFSALSLLLLLVGYWLWNANKKNGQEKKRILPPKKVLPYILVMAICLFAANYFQTVATNDYGVSSQMLYPIIKGGCLITVSFTAMIFFGEKFTLRSVCGMLIALAGIISMSIL